jgi:hypothetical protein
MAKAPTVSGIGMLHHCFALAEPQSWVQAAPPDARAFAWVRRELRHG